MTDYDQNRKDLEAARRIVSRSGSFVGRGGTMRGNISVAIAEGIALGEGLEIAAKLIADKIKASD